MLTLELLTELQSSAGEELIAAAGAHLDDPLRGISALRRQARPELAAAAYEQARLRARAAGKFSRADRMFFTNALLEQASAEVVARWRAARYAGQPWVADLCCGLGGDALALAATSRVAAVDCDPLALALTRANALAAQSGDRVFPIEGRVPGCLPRVEAVFVDPARRTPGERGRTRRVEQMSPPLSAVLEIYPRLRELGVKLSPAASHAELDALLADIPHEREAISVGRECRELVVWMGRFAGVPRQATLLPEGRSLVGTGKEELDIRGPGCYLYEPDAAVIRARLVARAAEEIGAWGVDPSLAYLSADRYVRSPWAVAYRIEPPQPFSRKALADLLRRRGARDLVLKTRGFAEDPEVIRRQVRRALDLSRGAVRPVVFLTRLGGRAVIIVGERLGAGTEESGSGLPAAG